MNQSTNQSTSTVINYLDSVTLELKCVANLSLMPILKPLLRRLAKLFETVTPQNGKDRPLHPLLARRHSTNRFLLKR